MISIASLGVAVSVASPDSADVDLFAPELVPVGVGVIEPVVSPEVSVAVEADPVSKFDGMAPVGGG